MTSIAVLAAADSRGAASVYLLSDSRVTWRSTGSQWDHARKTFASRTTPDIFAYCGDAFFPTIALSQVVNLFDVGLAAAPDMVFADRFNVMRGHLAKVFRTYPGSAEPVTILHAGRDNSEMKSIFRVGVLTSGSGTTRWKASITEVPPTGSGLIRSHGSGRTAIRRAVQTWRQSMTRPTSRVAYIAFVDAVKSGNDPHTGGPPHLVGLYRIGNGRQFGIIRDRAGYLAGMPVGHQAADPQNIEWRNDSFERVSVVTRRRLPGAQRHRERSVRPTP